MAARSADSAGAEAGIVLGSQETDGLYMFADRDITREELIAMAVRALGVDVLKDGTAGAPDFGDVSNWAADVVAFALEKQMINVDAAGNVNPLKNATRSEAAMVISVLLEYLGI